MNGIITDDEDCHGLATKKVFDQLGVAITPEIYRKYWEDLISWHSKN